MPCGEGSQQAEDWALHTSVSTNESGPAQRLYTTLMEGILSR